MYFANWISVQLHFTILVMMISWNTTSLIMSAYSLVLVATVIQNKNQNLVNQPTNLIIVITML